jgi:hypothetical protein
MKNKLLLLAMGFALTTQMIIAQVPSYVPTNGLVGYWPFNGNANDESGNGNNGVVYGSTLTTDRFGINNKSYGFNGISNKIEVDANSQFQLTTLTVSLWVNAISGFSLVNKSNWSNGNLETFNFGLGNTLLNSSIKINSNCFAGAGWNNITTNTGSLYNNWNHLVVTFNGVVVKHYVNGVQVNSQPLIGLMDTCLGGQLKFGAWWRNSPDYLNGKLDDIGIWNRALTQDEVTSLYYADNSCQSLVINTGVLSFNPPTYNNTITIYPNPANDQITIDCGNLANVSGWNIKIVNTLGQEVFSGAMNTQQYVVPLNTWSGQGIYFVKIYNASNNLMNTKKIILQ